jgi:hypothetical protein
MRRIKYFNLASFIMLMILLSGCASKMEQTTYSTLAISQTTYETTLSIIGDLYKQGKVPEAVKDEIVAKAREYRKAHNLTVEAFLLYKQSEEIAKEKDYLVNLTRTTVLLTELLQLVEPYVDKGDSK